jgi:hypothetical protein
MSRLTAFRVIRANTGLPYAVWYEVKRIFVPDIVTREITKPSDNVEMAWDGARCAKFLGIFSVLLELNVEGRYHITLSVWLLGRFRYIGTVYC